MYVTYTRGTRRVANIVLSLRDKRLPEMGPAGGVAYVTSDLIANLLTTHRPEWQLKPLRASAASVPQLDDTRSEMSYRHLILMAGILARTRVARKPASCVTSRNYKLAALIARLQQWARPPPTRAPRTLKLVPSHRPTPQAQRSEYGNLYHYWLAESCLET